jgi:uncharacterized membrane protein HdeD (DUF308 family)
MSDIPMTTGNVSRVPLTLDWWVVALRGVVAILFGVAAFILPVAAIGAFVLLFAIYMLFDGVFAIAAAVRAIRRHEHWGFLAFEGIADLVAGGIALAWPLITLIILIYLMGAWALVSGIFLLIATFRQPHAQGRWPMRIGALVSIAWGVLLLFAPVLGAVVLTWWIAAYALFFGGALLAFAYRLHQVQSHHAVQTVGGSGGNCL